MGDNCPQEEADRFEKGGPGNTPFVGGTLEIIVTYVFYIMFLLNPFLASDGR